MHKPDVCFVTAELRCNQLFKLSKHQKCLNTLRQWLLARKCWSPYLRIFPTGGYELKTLKVGGEGGGLRRENSECTAVQNWNFEELIHRRCYRAIRWLLPITEKWRLQFQELLLFYVYARSRKQYMNGERSTCKCSNGSWNMSSPYSCKSEQKHSAIKQNYRKKHQ